MQFVHIAAVYNGELVALTNEGRLFQRTKQNGLYAKWVEIPADHRFVSFTVHHDGQVVGLTRDGRIFQRVKHMVSRDHEWHEVPTDQFQHADPGGMELESWSTEQTAKSAAKSGARR